MAKKKSSRQKKEMAGNIRKRMISSQKTLVDTAEEIESSKEMATSVSAVAVSIEALTEGQEKLFNDLIEELSKIPETLGEKEVKSEKVLEKLVDAIFSLEKQLETTTDLEQRAKIEQGITTLRGQTDVALQGTSATKQPALKGPADVISKFLGVDPKERKEAGGGVKGFLKAFVGQDKDSGIRGDIDKYFGIQPQAKERNVDDMLEARRGSSDIAGTLEAAKTEKENERKAAVVARLKDVPEYLKVKSDVVGRYRESKTGNRLDEYLPSGELNPRFQPASGMMGAQLTDEKTGYTYEAGKGVQAGMVPGGAGASVPAALAAGAGTDADTDTFQEDVLKKMDGLEDQLEDVETASSEGVLGGLMKFLGPAVTGIAAIGPALLPIGVAIAGIYAGMKVFQAAKEFGKMREAQRGLKDAESGYQMGLEKNTEKVAEIEREDPQIVEEARKLQAEDPRKNVDLLGYVNQARRNRGGTSTTAQPALADATPITTPNQVDTVDPLRPTEAPVVGGFTGEQQERLKSYGLDIQEKENTRQELMSGLEDARRRGRTGSSSALENSASAPAAPATIINNIDNSSKVNAPQAAGATSGASVSLRDANNSFMRFQDRRMTRVF